MVERINRTRPRIVCINVIAKDLGAIDQNVTFKGDRRDGEIR